ncbi:MAG: hypothetical protein NVSMB2_03550 [Chloroflexota bacterium]
MPYPESCPECGGAFRNSGTHFTARRNEIGRHVLLELGCQNTSRRYWWDFTTGNITEGGRTVPARRASSVNGHHNGASHLAGSTATVTSDHGARLTLSTLDRAETTPMTLPQDTDRDRQHAPSTTASPAPEGLDEAIASLGAVLHPSALTEASAPVTSAPVELAGPRPHVPPALKDAFVRQLQLDRLTLRQMRAWLMSDEARRAIEVAAAATEATYERLALILFGTDLGQLSGRPAPVQASGMSAEERLEVQREKARIRARVRRAAAKVSRGGA